MSRRRRLLAALLLLLLLPGPATAGEVRRGRTSWSGVLAREIGYAVYLPDGYGRDAKRYPVLFLLHGLGGAAVDWLDAGRLATELDRLTAADAVPPMIVVIPGLGDGWYVDNPDPGGEGAVRRAFLDEFVPAIDRAWRTRGDRGSRAVAGLSMGGWGAMRFAMLRPDLFAAAASLSGALVTDAKAATPAWAGLFKGAFGEPVDLDRFRAASPFGMISGFAATTVRPMLFLTCGDDDELDLEEDNLMFYLALKRAGVEVELRITDGGHDWTVWARELEPVLRFVGGAFGRGEGG